MRKSLLLLLILASLSAQKKDDAEMQGFAVSPLKITVDARRGGRSTSKLTILAQNTKKPLKLEISVQDLKQDENGSKIIAPIGQGARSASRWIKIERSVNLPPNGKKTIPFSINVPPTASGAYYSYIVVKLIPPKGKAQFQTVIQPSVAVEVEVKVRSSAPLHMDVKNLYLESQNRFLVLELHNTGKWKTSVEGDVLLYRKSSLSPIRVEIPFRTGGVPFEIYPGMTVKVICPIDRAVRPGTYRAIARLLLNGKWKSNSEFELYVPGEKSAALKSKKLRNVEFDLDISVEPRIIELSLPYRGSRTIPVRVTNHDKRKAEIRATISNVKLEKSGFLTYLKTPVKGDWISLSTDKVILEPNRTHTFLVRVTTPPGYEKDSFAVAAVRIRAKALSKSGKWLSENDFGVLLSVNDPRVPPADIRVLKPRLIRPAPEKNPTTAVVKVKNTGKRIAKIHGKILLERADGSVISTMYIGKTEDEIILPGNIREFRMPIIPLDAGKFRVKAVIYLGESTTPVVSSVSFRSKSSVPEGL